MQTYRSFLTIALKTVFCFFVCFFIIKANCYAQKTTDIGTAYHRIIYELNDTLYQFYVSNPDKNVRLIDDEVYFWYRPDTVLQTVGGFQGRLLNGPFTKYYPNKNIALKQTYAMGRRSGEERSWYSNGKLWTIITWSEGKRNGKFSIYDSVGTLIQHGQYKNDKLNGNIYVLSAGKITKEKYNAGVLQKQDVNKNDETEKVGDHADH